MDYDAVCAGKGKTDQAMKNTFRHISPKHLTRLLLAALTATLMACASSGADPQSQAAPANTPEHAAEQTPQSATAPEAPSQNTASLPLSGIAHEGTPVTVLVADTVEQEGWLAVPVQGGMLYLNPQPVVTRSDLTGVQAGRGRSNEGLLALGLSLEAQIRLRNVTTQFANKRLALVIGRNMVAAPGYTAPVSSDRLVFPVGTPQNAAEAVLAITGEGAE